MSKPRTLSGSGRISLQCAACGRSFERWICTIRVPVEQVTCSRACKIRFKPLKKRAPRHAIVCEHCGGPFSVLPNRVMRKHAARFCSVKCLHAFQRGVNHPSYVNGVARQRGQYRKMMRKRVREVGHCEECGATEALHAHHVKHYSTHPELRSDPDNIKVLCRVCHAKEHPNVAAKIFEGSPRTGAIKSCPICETKFYVKRSHLPHRICCSFRCGLKHRMQHLTVARSDQSDLGER